MRFLPDDRGQSIQIGAVLLFAVLIILLALWQAVIVPNQNEEIEFNHNEDLQQQMTELRSTVNSMPDADATRSVTLDLGVRYPSRTIFRNPPPVRGTVETVGSPDGPMTATIENASAVDREGNTATYWDGSARGYGTKAVQYRPAYNRYDNAPRTIYEHSVLFNEFDTERQDLSLSGQTLVRGNRLSLVTVNGSLSESRVDSSSVDFRPVSTETETVVVEPDGGPITLELPTRLSQGEWRAVFEDVQTVDASNVVVNDSAFPDNEDLGLLRVRLDETDADGNTQTYRLRLAKVGVGAGVTDTTPTYVTQVSGDESVIQRGETQSLTVQVRDEYNGPISGVGVNVSAEGGQFANGADTVSTTTGTDGEATVQYTGTVVGTNAINVSIAGGYQPVPGADHDVSAPENLTMTVDVEQPPTSGPGGGGSAFNVSWDRAIIENADGIESRAGDSFEYDAAAGGELTLPMFTDPIADGAAVNYATSNQLRATVTPASGTTGSNGRDSTVFEARRTGEVDVYTYSGGDGDRITINVTDVDLGTLDVDPNLANSSSVHNWSFNDVPFGGEVDNITASYPAGTSFDGLDNTDITVFLTRAGDSSPTEIDVNSATYSGSTATFDLDGTFNTDIDGPSWVEIDGLENPSPGNYTATLTFRGAEDELPITKEFTIREPSRTLSLTPANAQIQPGDSNDIDVLLEDETGSPIANEDVDLTVASGNGTFAGSGTQTVTVTTDGSGQATATYDSVSSDQGTTVQIDGEQASDASVSDSATFDVIASAGFSSIDATDIVPNANGQTQTFTFSPDTTLPSSESLDIVLDDPQQQSPLVVDYSNAAITSNRSQSDENVNAGGDTATLTVSFSNDIGPGETVRVTVSSVNAGAASNQNSPYDAVFNRSDTAPTSTTSFSVTRTAGDSGLAGVSASDLFEYDGTQIQQIELTPDGSLESEEVVAIDLSDAQSTSDASRVEYEGVSSVSEGGTDFSTINSGEGAYLLYTAPSGGTSDTVTVDLEVSNVVVDGSSNSFEVGFSRATADTDRTTFEVRVDNTAPTISPVDPQPGDNVSDDQQVIEATITDNDAGVDESSIRVTVTDANGNTPFDGAGVGTDGIDYSGDTLTIDVSAQGETYAEGDVDVSVEANDTVDNMATESWTFTVDTQDPTVQRFGLANPSGNELRVELDTDEALSEISVDIENSSGTVVQTLTRGDFSESVSGGTYTYSASYTVSEEGNYTAVLNEATDFAGNDGASGETDTATVDTTPPSFDTLEIDTQQSNPSGKVDSVIVRTWATSDNLNVANVTFVVYDENGNRVDRTTNAGQNGADLTLNGGDNRNIRIVAIVADGKSNTQQCEVSGVSGNNFFRKSNGDFTCTATTVS